MMERVFLHLLNMSITAAWITFVVIALRLILKKAPKWIMSLLWGLVAVRLICPFSFESMFSLIPSAETVPQEMLSTGVGAINSGFNIINQTVNPVISAAAASNAAESANPIQTAMLIATAVWLAGMAVMLSYTLISYFRIRGKVREAVKTDNGYWACDRIPAPFILGIFRPKIYMPPAMNEADIPYALAHERAHLKRRDYIWKPLGFLLLTVYWFNPVLWAAYILLCRDMELACDEKVIRQMGTEIKKPYSEALINCSVPRRMAAACPLAFGEAAVKGRVKSVLNYKKPAFWIIIVAVAACVIAAACLLTNPMGTRIDDSLAVFLDTAIVQQNQSGKTGDAFVTVDYKVLGTKNSGSKITVYMWVLYQEYSYDGRLRIEAGSHIPTAITAERKGGAAGAAYELVEYWIPRDGSYYADDIKSKFPARLHGKALDPTWCIDEQQASSLKSAQEYYGITTTPVYGADDPADVTIKPDARAFDAAVLEVNAGSIVVQPAAGSEELNSSDKISVSLNGLDSGALPDMKAGDKIRIIYGGSIGETYPAQISTVYAIYSLDSSGQINYLAAFKPENCRRYTYESAVEPLLKPTIVLSNEGNLFQFTYSALSSYIPTGEYELTDKRLTLKAEHDQGTYVFNVVGNTFVFDAANSSEIPKYVYSNGEQAQCPVPDGAVFE